MKTKKGFTTLEYVVASLIVGIVVVLVLAAFLGPRMGLFNYFSRFVDTAQGWIPGKEGIESREPGSPEQFEDFFEKFKKALESAVSADEKCLIKYEKIEDFEGFDVELINAGKNLALRKRDKNKNPITQDEIKGISTCIVDSNAFFDNYLKKRLCIQDNTCKNDFTDVTSITFTADELNDEFGLEDNGLMYKPKKDRICFIPTHKGLPLVCNTDEKTINNDCLKTIQKRIRLCGEKPQLTAEDKKSNEMFQAFTAFMEDAEKIPKTGDVCYKEFDLTGMETGYYILVEKTGNKAKLSLKKYENGLDMDVMVPSSQIEKPIPYFELDNIPGYIEGQNSLFENENYKKQVDNFRNYVLASILLPVNPEYKQASFGQKKTVFLIQKNQNWILTTNQQIFNIRNKMGDKCEFLS